MSLWGWLFCSPTASDATACNDIDHEVSSGCAINPATGLPTVSGEAYGLDVGGNPFGMDVSAPISTPSISSDDSWSSFDPWSS